MVLYILGEAPNSVMAYGSNLFTKFGDTKDYDTANILNMPGGLVQHYIFQILGELPMVMTND